MCNDFSSDDSLKIINRLTSLCPEHPLDPLGHHAVTCKRGGDAISRHNKLRDVVLQTCHRACISAKAEAGSGLGHELRNTRPADILASNWLCGKPAVFDLTVVLPLNPTFISEAGRTAGSAAVAAELRKHSANDAKCSELGWTCIPLVAESYGAWGSEAVQAFSRLVSYLATRTNSPKSKVVCSLYGRLNLTLVRANARALLLRCGCPSGGGYFIIVTFIASVSQCVRVCMYVCMYVYVYKYYYYKNLLLGFKVKLINMI